MKKGRIFLGILWVTVLLAVIEISTIPGSSEIHFLSFLENWIPSADKIAHLAAYIFMAFTVTLFFTEKKMCRIFSVMALIFLGIVLEVLQIHVVGRTFSIMDLGANLLGVVIGFSTAWFFIRLGQKKNTPPEK